jgi:hypothetical protein
MGKRAPEMVEVYEPDTDYSLPPNGRIPFADGLRRVESGEATFAKHNRAIRLKSKTAMQNVMLYSSPRSSPALGVGDAEALAGVRPMSTRRRERLAGWNL